MLVLTRKIDESFYIEVDGNKEAIKIEVCSIQGKQVRIAISAPPYMKILREELLKIAA